MGGGAWGNEGADAQIVLDGQFRKQPPVFRGRGRCPARPCDAPEGRRTEWPSSVIAPPRSGTSPEMNAHQRGLAGAVRPDHPDRLALRHFERHVEQGAEGAVTGGNGGKATALRSGPVSCRDRPQSRGDRFAAVAGAPSRFSHRGSSTITRSTMRISTPMSARPR